jgi:hypothetical protein
MPKNKDRYEIHVDGKLHDAYKTRKSANLVATSLTGNVEIKDIDPPNKKHKSIEGEGFVMEQEVVDPHEPQKTTKVKRSRHQHIIERMHQRGLITIQQFIAAQRYYHAKMASSGQTGLGMDYAKERVDTFGNGESIQVSELNAKQDLQDANKQLSKIEVYRLEAILVQEQTLRRYCLKTFRTDNTRRQQEESKRLKQSLTTLAILWGYENKAKKVA